MHHFNAFLKLWINRTLCGIALAPIRIALALLIGGRLIGGAIYSVAEPDADWFDGAWWALVTQTTVGYGDFAPDTFVGRMTAEIIMWTAILAVSIVTAEIAGVLSAKRIEPHLGTPDLDDDFDHCIAEMQALKRRYVQKHGVEP
jgi:hypothetical protein